MSVQGPVNDQDIEPVPSLATDRIETNVSDPYSGRRAMSIKLTQAIYLIFGVIEVLLLIRFALKALGANAETGFAQLMYAVTGPLVAPFLGLFGTSTATGGAVLEPYTLLAFVIYAAVGWVLARVIWLLIGETRSASVARTDTVQTRVHQSRP
jgi:YggT family protein